MEVIRGFGEKMSHPYKRIVRVIFYDFGTDIDPQWRKEASQLQQQTKHLFFRFFPTRTFRFWIEENPLLPLLGSTMLYEASGETRQVEWTVSKERVLRVKSHIYGNGSSGTTFWWLSFENRPIKLQRTVLWQLSTPPPSLVAFSLVN